jgi:septal ring factor EnvC (AmiA/AmiB activator)
MIRQFFLLALVLPVLLFGQEDIDRQLKNNRSQLEKVKGEITRLKNKIKATSTQTASILGQLKSLDREVELIDQAQMLLERESRLLNTKISTTKKRLTEHNASLKDLQEHYRKRVLHNYKYGKLQTLELLFTAGSINRALVRYKYLRYFADQEKRLVEKIKTNIAVISELEKSLNKQLSDHKNTLKEKERQRDEYIVRKNEKTALVARLRWNQNTLKQELDNREQEYQRLFGFIKALEKQRKEREAARKTEKTEQVFVQFDDFKKAKGKLPWPVPGSVLHKYGKQKHASMKTYTNNTGIDIKANEGQKVRLIFSGQISMVTYLPGYGKTVIAEHGKGYYTVYAHLGEVYVTKGDFLRAGETLGLVGDTGSLEGSKLHFEIYESENTVNPLYWLKKN